MEYVGNLCSPCPLREQPKGESIIVGHTNSYAMFKTDNKSLNLCNKDPTITNDVVNLTLYRDPY